MGRGRRGALRLAGGLTVVGFDGSAPIGPTLVSPEAIPDPQALRIRAIHNGKTVQDSNTK